MDHPPKTRWRIVIAAIASVAGGCAFAIGSLTNIIPPGKAVVAGVLITAIFGISPAIIAAIPWSRLQFSVRTMLIVTTLVAVVLGLVVWLSR